MPINLTPDFIAAAILGFEEQKRQIDSKIAELKALLSGASVEAESALGRTKAKRRTMSADARARIAAAQRKRWAASRKVSKPEAPAKPKRKLSDAGRAAIVAATKKRWALKRAQAAK